MRHEFLSCAAGIVLRATGVGAGLGVPLGVGWSPFEADPVATTPRHHPQPGRRRAPAGRREALHGLVPDRSPEHSYVNG